jgi:hypothetical protein
MKYVYAGLGLVAITSFALAAYYVDDKSLRVGMRVTNGYCIGKIAALTRDEAKIINPECGDQTYNYVWIERSELKELK